MVRFDYLIKGLDAMSRAHRVNTMAGHLGAALVAGYLIAEQHPQLDDRVYAGIEGELDRIIHGESVFSPREGSPITVDDMFEPHGEEVTKAELVEDIAEALARNIDEPHESGHNAIFAAIAIRALKDHPTLAVPPVVHGICRLIAGFDNTKPGSGFYGRLRGRIDGRAVPLPKDDAFPPYAGLSAMAEVVVEELNRTAGERRDGFGGIWHIVNHAAALAELAAYGYADLATKGLPSHHRHMRLFRTLPNVADEFGDETPAMYDPRTPEFWDGRQEIRRDRARLTHRIKTLYGFDALVHLVADEDRRRIANERLLYLM
jgi:hypothetical protein